jgi:hypothetical protein
MPVDFLGSFGIVKFGIVKKEWTGSGRFDGSSFVPLKDSRNEALRGRNAVVAGVV